MKMVKSKWKHVFLVCLVLLLTMVSVIPIEAVETWYDVEVKGIYVYASHTFDSAGDDFGEFYIRARLIVDNKWKTRFSEPKRSIKAEKDDDTVQDIITLNDNQQMKSTDYLCFQLIELDPWLNPPEGIAPGLYINSDGYYYYKTFPGMGTFTWRFDQTSTGDSYFKVEVTIS
ncbi:MAG: hypothetical protein ACFFC7_10995 [Candidatus Hermodarchaeota archaeon]